MTKFVVSHLTDCWWHVPLAICDTLEDCDMVVKDHSRHRCPVILVRDGDELEPQIPCVRQYCTRTGGVSEYSYVVSRLP